ncbi:MAG: hypothetical protein CMI15_02845 [Opitutaceae bacterium]|nr:hypothetical protein [Opitutaceae bacterium]
MSLFSNRIRIQTFIAVSSALTGGLVLADPEFDSSIRPLIEDYCITCHGGEKVKGEVDFSEIMEADNFSDHFEIWETVADVLDFGDMPPEDEEHRPSSDEVQQILSWYEDRFVHSVEARAADFRPRRLSASEYRNTLRSVLGFDLETTIMGAEQTVTERSLVLKLLPDDPPGESGYMNDTRNAPLSSHLWEQHAYIADRAIVELFSSERRQALAQLIGEELPGDFQAGEMTNGQASSLLLHLCKLANRRPIPESSLHSAFASLQGLSGETLLNATKREIKAILVSPSFLYRGLLVEGEPGEQQRVDAFELAERLSYFLWEDMPDASLMEAAESGELLNRDGLASQIDRMLASSKALNLSESFGHQWLGLADIDSAADDATTRGSLRGQPLDFLHYLFTEDRPVMELIDSDVAFTSYLTAKFYPEDREQLSKYVKPKGIERQLVPNERIKIEKDQERGGILTMPGILAMNRGPILRGTWMLRRILGERLGEPPADVPPIQATAPDSKLSFRDRFDQHRADSTCARCHDRIDPLGFALQEYDDDGAYKLAANYKPPRRVSDHDEPINEIDTSGTMPTGESFANFQELKDILLTSKREDIIRNIVEQVLSYALCRKLEVYDRATVDDITKTIDQSDGSWEDLFLEVALSLPFQETRLPEIAN